MKNELEELPDLPKLPRQKSSARGSAGTIGWGLCKQLARSLRSSACGLSSDLDVDSLPPQAARWRKAGSTCLLASAFVLGGCGSKSHDLESWLRTNAAQPFERLEVEWKSLTGSQLLYTSYNRQGSSYRYDLEQTIRQELEGWPVATIEEVLSEEQEFARKHPEEIFFVPLEKMSPSASGLMLAMAKEVGMPGDGKSYLRASRLLCMTMADARSHMESRRGKKKPDRLSPVFYAFEPEMLDLWHPFDGGKHLAFDRFVCNKDTPGFLVTLVYMTRQEALVYSRFDTFRDKNVDELGRDEDKERCGFSIETTALPTTVKVACYLSGRWSRERANDSIGDLIFFSVDGLRNYLDRLVEVERSNLGKSMPESDKNFLRGALGASVRWLEVER